MSGGFELERYLERQRARIEPALDRFLPGLDEPPCRLHEAMRYSVQAGGKRLRPILCLAAAEACGGSPDIALYPAVALEFLHTYTLIHDDLPAMDNDDLRRGLPTSHKMFGEANAILAGDSLLTLAFEVLAQTPLDDPRGVAGLVRELAAAAGSRGVVGGQHEDLAGEGQAPDAARLEWIHLHKTAVLIQAACRLGALAAGAPAAACAALSDYGLQAGLAFQIADDLLNETSTAEQLGKAVKTDAARSKMTYPALFGMAMARGKAEDLVGAAVARLEPLGRAALPLQFLARFMVTRSR